MCYSYKLAMSFHKESVNNSQNLKMHPLLSGLVQPAGKPAPSVSLSVGLKRQQAKQWQGVSCDTAALCPSSPPVGMAQQESTLRLAGNVLSLTQNA